MQNFYATRSKQESVAALDSNKKVAFAIKLQEKNLATSLIDGSGGNMPKKNSGELCKKIHI